MFSSSEILSLRRNYSLRGLFSGKDDMCDSADVWSAVLTEIFKSGRDWFCALTFCIVGDDVGSVLLLRAATVQPSRFGGA